MHDQAHRHRHDVRFTADAPGIRHLITVGRFGGTGRRFTENAATAAIDHIDPERLDARGQRDALRWPPAGIVLGRQAQKQRLVGRPIRAHALNHFTGKAHAIGLRAAIFITALIRQRREKLVQQKTMRAVNLDHIKPGHMRARSGLAPGFHRGSNLCFGERTRHRRALVRRNRARRDQFPCVPIVHPFGLGHRTVERAATLPRALAARLAARVAKLNPGGGAAVMNQTGDARQLRHEAVIPQTQIANRAAAAARDFGGFDHHQPGTAGSVAARVHDVPVVGKALDASVLVHRCHHHAVFESEAADCQRCE